MSPHSDRWARSLTGVLAVLTIGAVALLGLAVVASTGGFGREEDQLGAAIALVAAVLVALGLAVVASLWWLTSTGRRRAADGRADRRLLAAALSLAVGIGIAFFPALLADIVSPLALIAVPFLVVGTALVVTSGGLLRSLRQV